MSSFDQALYDSRIREVRLLRCRYDVLVRQATYDWAAKIFVFGMAGLALLVGICGHSLLVILASTRYANALWVIFPLALAMLFKSISNFFSLGIVFAKKMSAKIYAYALFTATSLTAATLLGRWLGITGVAWGLLIGYVAGLVSESWLSNRVFPIAWPYTRIASVLCYTVFVGLLAEILAKQLSPSVAKVEMVGGLVAFFPICWLILFTADQRKRLVELCAHTAAMCWSALSSTKARYCG